MTNREEYLINEIRHKQGLINLSLRAATGPGGSEGLTEYFNAQAERIKKELEPLQEELKTLKGRSKPLKGKKNVKTNKKPRKSR